MIETFGAIPSSHDRRDYTVAMLAPVSTDHPMYHAPAWRPEVYNQGMIGSCVAFALRTIREMQEYMETGKYRPLSAGFIYANRQQTDHQGEGLMPRQALKNMASDGICLHALMPHNRFYQLLKNSLTQEMYENAKPRHIAAYARAEATAEILSAIRELQAVLFVVPVYQNFVDGGRNGVIEAPQPGLDILGYHAITVWGWEGYEPGKKFYFTGQNSWGTSWGDNGTFKLSSEYPVTEVWTITDAPTLHLDRYYKLKIGSELMVDMETGREIRVKAPILHEEKTMVPLRVIAEALGVPVHWVHEEKAILIGKLERSFANE